MNENVECTKEAQRIRGSSALNTGKHECFDAIKTIDELIKAAVTKSEETKTNNMLIDCNDSNTSICSTFTQDDVDCNVLECPSIRSIEEKIAKLEIFMSEQGELKNNLAKVNSTMEQFFLETEKWHTEMSNLREAHQQRADQQKRMHQMRMQIETLYAENLNLKAELGDKKVDIVCMQEKMKRMKENQLHKHEVANNVKPNNNHCLEWKFQPIEKTATVDQIEAFIAEIETAQLAFNKFVANVIKETKKKADCTENIEYARLMKEFEKKIAVFRTEVLDLKFKQKQNTSEIVVVQLNLTEAENLINQARADIKQLQDMDVKNEEQQKQSLNELEMNIENIQKNFIILQKEFEGTKHFVIQNSTSSEGTFTYAIHLNQLKLDRFSPTFYVHLIPWQIRTFRKHGFFQCFLYCKIADELPDITCKADAEFRLKCHKHRSTTSIVHRFTNQTFNDKNEAWGYSEFIEWHKLIDPCNGFLKKKTITLEVYVKADAPKGPPISLNTPV